MAMKIKLIQSSRNFRDFEVVFHEGFLKDKKLWISAEILCQLMVYTGEPILINDESLFQFAAHGKELIYKSQNRGNNREFFKELATLFNKRHGPDASVNWYIE